MDPLIIAHNLKKEAGATNNAEPVWRSDLYSHEDPVIEKLVSGIRRSVSHASKVAKFERDEDEQPRILERLAKDFQKNQTPDAFRELSVNAVNALKSRIQKKVGATGGYVVFIYFHAQGKSANGSHFLVIALLKEMAIPAFDEEMNPINAIGLDLDHLKHGVRIRFSSLDNNEDGVISILPSRAAEPADYFAEFIGASELTKSKEIAKNLYRRALEWCQLEGLSSEDTSALIYKIFRYHKDNNGNRKGLSIKGLGNSLYPEESTQFVTFMTDEAEGVPGQTPPLKPSDMRRFQKISYSDKGLTVAFDIGGEHNWQNKVIVQDSSVVIRNAPADLIRKINNRRDD